MLLCKWKMEIPEPFFGAVAATGQLAQWQVFLTVVKFQQFVPGCWPGQRVLLRPMAAN